MSIDKLAWDKTRVGDTFGCLQVARLMPGGLAVVSSDVRHPDGLFIPLASQYGPGRLNDVVRGELCPECETTSVGGSIHASCQGEPTITPQEVAAMAGAELQENYGHEDLTFGPWPEALRGLEIIVLDFETTGFNIETGDRPVELAVVKMTEDGIVDQDSWLINPERPIPATATAIHSITDAMVANEPTYDVIVESFLDFLGDCQVICGHNLIKFDSKFLKFGFDQYGIPKPALKMIDTLDLARGRWSTGRVAGKVRNHKLGTLLEHIGVEHGQAHRGLDDSIATAKLLNHLLVLLAEEEEAEREEAARAAHGDPE